MRGMHATLRIPIRSEKQLKHVQEAQEKLLDAWVEFASGYDLREGVEEWEFDISLKGAELLEDSTLRFDAEAIDEEMKHILLAEVELVEAGVVFEYGFDDFNHRLWRLGKLQGAELMVRKVVG